MPVVPEVILPYKPFFKELPTFDVEHGFYCSFMYYGGNFDFVELEFYSNTTGSLVLSWPDSAHDYDILIPSSYTSRYLENGESYNIRMRVSDSSSNTATYTSSWSDYAIVYCFSIPQFYFDPEPETVTNSYFEAHLVYTQAQGEPLDTYRFQLYSSDTPQVFIDRDPVFDTGTLYDTWNLSYLFQNLLNQKYYILKAYGTTKHKIPDCIAYLSFYVNYDAVQSFSNIKLTNIPNLGAVEIAGNLSVIEGHTNPPNQPRFIDNSEIDLITDSDSYVMFDDGFDIEDEFVVEMVGRNLTPFTNILTMSNDTTTITVEYKIGDFESYTGGTSTYYGRSGKWCGYFELKVANKLTNDFIISYVGISNYINYININHRIPNTEVFIWLKHCDVDVPILDENENQIGTKTYHNLFEIKAEVL